jgi:uncharacterized protein (UPF0297 family)
MNTELNFYKQPFRMNEYSSWVYDAKSNFVFQFKPKWDAKGNYAEGEEKLMKDVIESLNSKEHKPIENISLTVREDDPNCIDNNDKGFILIRGWGNLTGIGGYNLPGEVAAKIQDDFRDWIISKLSKQV